jgi:hypothetical protein
MHVIGHSLSLSLSLSENPDSNPSSPSQIQIIEPHRGTELALVDGAHTSFLIRKIWAA